MNQSDFSKKKIFTWAIIFCFGSLSILFVNCSKYASSNSEIKNGNQLSPQSVSFEKDLQKISRSSSRLKVFTFSKAKFDDAVGQQQRAAEATDYVTKNILSWAPSAEITKIDEKIFALLNPKSPVQISDVVITKSKLLAEWKKFASTVSNEDTVIIYSHSHGKDNDDSTGKEGGFIIEEPELDAKGNPVVLPKRGVLTQKFTESILTWSEYSNLILSLPAKNVMVFTMACFSGNLVNILNSNALKQQWQGRKDSGRSFAVVSAQNADLLSGPNKNIGGSPYTMNGLPFALANAFKNDYINISADGYSRAVGGKYSPSYQGVVDRELSFSELVYYVHDYSRDLGSNASYKNESMFTGSWVEDSVAQPVPYQPIAQVPTSSILPAGFVKAYNSAYHSYGNGTICGYTSLSHMETCGDNPDQYFSAINLAKVPDSSIYVGNCQCGNAIPKLPIIKDEYGTGYRVLGANSFCAYNSMDHLVTCGEKEMDYVNARSVSRSVLGSVSIPLCQCGNQVYGIEAFRFSGGAYLSDGVGNYCGFADIPQMQRCGVKRSYNQLSIKYAVPSTMKYTGVCGC
jgi:hypothetical protein